MYKTHFERAVNPTNLAMLINSYIHRTDLHIARTPSGTPQSSKTLKMPVINITGSLSPHSDDTVTFNGRLDPTNSSWMKVSYFSSFGLISDYGLINYLIKVLHRPNDINVGNFVFILSDLRLCNGS